MTRFNFRKQESNRYVRVSKSYRRPKGFHSKMREHRKGNLRLPEAGFGSPVETRGLHPCGLQETLVFNTATLSSMDPKAFAVRISATVSHPKKNRIAEEAKKLGLKVLNPPKAREKKKEAGKSEAKTETPKEMKTRAGSEAPINTPAKQKKAAGAGGGSEK